MEHHATLCPLPTLKLTHFVEPLNIEQSLVTVDHKVRQLSQIIMLNLGSGSPQIKIKPYRPVGWRISNKRLPKVKVEKIININPTLEG